MGPHNKTTKPAKMTAEGDKYVAVISHKGMYIINWVETLPLSSG